MPRLPAEQKAKDGHAREQQSGANREASIPPAAEGDGEDRAQAQNRVIGISSLAVVDLELAGELKRIGIKRGGGVLRRPAGKRVQGGQQAAQALGQGRDARVCVQGCVANQVRQCSAQREWGIQGAGLR